MASSTIEQVKEKLDITDFVRTYLNLTPAGKNFKTNCPFHKEKTPSFIVSPDRQTWHCFGCGLGGDAIAFLMKYENIEFIEALKILAERTGVDFKTSGGSDQRQYKILYDINDAAKDFFRAQLSNKTEVGKKALQYLISDRGLTQETLREFEIGFVPNASDALSKYLATKGFTIQAIEKAGFVIKTERGTYWDRFRNRIMFPIHNHFGKVVGFTGRLMPDAEESNAGKYMNSPETPIFNKSKLLFGFFKSKNEMRDNKTAFLVEGQMDFLSVWQDGVKNVVATSGTAVTPEHLKNLKRACDTIVVGFDSDTAGQTATERVIDMANAADFSVKIIDTSSLSGNLVDPADIVMKHPGKIAELLRDAKPAMHHYFIRYLDPQQLSENKHDITALKRNIRAVLEKIKVIASPVEQSHWIHELSSRTHIAEPQLFEEMKGLAASKTQSLKNTKDIQQKQESQAFSRRDLITHRILSLVAFDSGCKSEMKDNIKFLTNDYGQIFTYLSNEDKSKGLPVALQSIANFISMRSSLEEGEEKDRKIEFEKLIHALKQEYYKEERSSLEMRIRTAEAAGNHDEVEKALAEFSRIAKEG